jgi:hypothetical protein
VEPIKEEKKVKTEPLDLDPKGWTDSISANEKVSARPSKQRVKTKGTSTNKTGEGQEIIPHRPARSSTLSPASVFPPHP